MSYDLQAEGLNGVNIQTSIIAGHDWVSNTVEGAASPPCVVFVSGTAPDVPSPLDADAIIGQGNLHGNGVTGWGGRQAGSGVVGIAGSALFHQSPSAIRGQNAGVYGTGEGGTTAAVGVIGQGGPASAGVVGFAGAGIADGVQGFGGSGGGKGVFGQGGDATSAGANPGVVGVGGTKAPNDGVQGFGNGNFAGVAGFGGGSNGPGVRGNAGGANTDPGTPVGVFGQGANGFEGVLGFDSGGRSAGVRGVSSATNGIGVRGEGDNGPFAVGILGSSNQGLAGLFFGAVTVHGNFNVLGGAKSAVVAFPDGSRRRLYCMESPECWFEDFGVGQLVNGQAEVQLDPDFSSVVNGDAYHVFITEYEDNNALYVTKRTSTGFVVRAKAKAAAGTFSYRVVTKRKDIAAPRFEKVTLPPESLHRSASH